MDAPPRSSDELGRWHHGHASRNRNGRVGHLRQRRDNNPLQQVRSTDRIAIFSKPVYFDPDTGTTAAHDLALLARMCGMIGGLLVAVTLMKRQLDRHSWPD